MSRKAVAEEFSLGGRPFLSTSRHDESAPQPMPGIDAGANDQNALKVSVVSERVMPGTFDTLSLMNLPISTPSSI